MQDCIFCKIISGQSSGQLVYQDEQVTAFHDIHPAAPVHILIVPNRHIASINELGMEDEPLLGRIFTVARQLAQQKELGNRGYRLVINTGPDAGQAVFHLHLHLLGGGRMPFPRIV